MRRCLIHLHFHKASQLKRFIYHFMLMQRISATKTMLIAISLVSFLAPASYVCAIAGEPGVPLHVNNSVFSDAQLSELDADLRWSFLISEKTVAIRQDQLVRWGAWPGIVRGPAIWLSDGSWLSGNLKFSGDDFVSVEGDWLENVRIALRDVRGIVLTAPASLPEWNRLQSQMADWNGQRDAIWLSGERQVSGIIRWGQVNPFSNELDQIELEGDQQSTAIELAEVRQIVFSPALFGRVTSKSSSVEIGLSDGSLLKVRELKRSGSRVTLVLESGLELTSLDSGAEFCESVRYLLGSPAGTKFLTDLTAASYRHVSRTTLEWSLGKDRDLLDRPMMNHAGIVARGLAMHSNSQIAYRWDGKPARLLAEARLAQPAPGADEDLGSVACEVLVARRGKLERANIFSLDRTSNRSAFVDVELSGAQLIALVVDEGDAGPYGDHVLWLDARISEIISR